MEIDEYLVNGLINALLKKRIITKSAIKEEIRAIKRKERKEWEKISFKELFTEEEKKAIKEVLQQRIKFGATSWASGMFHDHVLRPLYKWFESRGGEEDLENLYDILEDHKRISEEFYKVKYNEKPIIKKVKRRIKEILRDKSE